MDDLLASDIWDGLIKSLTAATSNNTGENTPLWKLSEWITFNTLGGDENYKVSLSFLYLLLTAVFVFKTGKLLWNKKTGMIAAVLTFMNPYFFIYTFEIRTYSIITFGVTASMFYFFRIFYSEEIKKIDKLGYVLTSLWSLYSHPIAFFVLITQFIWVLYELLLGKRKRVKKIFKLFILIFIGGFPLILVLSSQIKAFENKLQLVYLKPEHYKGLFYYYIGEGIGQFDYILPLLRVRLYEMGIYLMFIILILRRWHKGIKKSILLILLFVLPTALTMSFLILQSDQSALFNEDLLYTVPNAMLLTASKRRGTSTIILVIVIIIFAFINYHYLTYKNVLFS